MEGDVAESIQRYLKGDYKSNPHNTQLNLIDRKGNGVVKLKDILLYGETEGHMPQTGEVLNMRFYLNNPENISKNEIRLDIRIDDEVGQRMLWLSTSIFDNGTLDSGQNDLINFNIKRLNLNEGRYYITTHISVNKDVSDWIQNAFVFHVNTGDFYGNGKRVPVNQSKILTEFTNT